METPDGHESSRTRWSERVSHRYSWSSLRPFVRWQSRFSPPRYGCVLANDAGVN